MSDRWTWHGGGLDAARARYGEGPWIDLSTGINPHAWPGDVAVDWRRLPEEGDLAKLEAAAAAHFDTDPIHVCAVPGSEIALRLAAGLLPCPAAYVVPAYGTHANMFADARALPACDVETSSARTLLLANPNNPDGRLLSPDWLQNLLHRRGDGWLLIDEAFADVAPHASVASLVGERRLIVFRSFGKFFGLAGLRLGFVLGPPDFLARLRAQIGAWPVSAAAIAIGAAAYRDRDWIIATRKRLTSEAAALDALLMRCGLTAVGACPLFRLVETDDARVLFERLSESFILTRPFDHNPRWLRIGLPADADASGRLETALRG